MRGVAADVREDRLGKLHFGDIVIAINDDEVVSNDSLLSALEKYKPGDEVTVTTRIDDTIREYQVILDKPQ